MSKYAGIVGWGKCLPPKVVTNDDLARVVNTSDEWIVSHTGIRERRVVEPGQTTVPMAVAAARDALSVAGLLPAGLDLIIVSTYSPDNTNWEPQRLRHLIYVRAVLVFSMAWL